ncbi:hypothetical protein H9P43_002980 [Blastocladiella emersonii ATCC 22665]|nr:hypothetical protein H9P43_002980 [Blastocladiella emersonii ATCC 22665]
MQSCLQACLRRARAPSPPPAVRFQRLAAAMSNSPSGRPQVNYIRAVANDPVRGPQYTAQTFHDVTAPIDLAVDRECAVPGSRFCALESQRPENLPHNRYSNIFPFDVNRVPVANAAGGDYINASVIQVPLTNAMMRDNAYIAMQGPQPHTVGNVWRMVYQRQVRLIVCLTKQVESRRVKYDQYWAEDGDFEVPMGGAATLTVDHVAIETPEAPGDMLASYQRQLAVGRRYRATEAAAGTVANLAGVTLRKFDLTYKCPEQGDYTTTVWQLDAPLWPDHGTVDVDALLSLMELARFVSPSLRNPMVVHCSAGCGRTGTFIAVDVITRYLEAKLAFPEWDRHEDIVAAVVADLRSQRVQMVQTRGQFELVYQAVARYLKDMGIH